MHMTSSIWKEGKGFPRSISRKWTTKTMKMKDWLKNNIVSTFTLGAMLLIAYKSGLFEQRLFTTVEMRVKTESEIENAPSAAQRKMALYLDSVNAVHAMHSRNKRDSIMKHQDSINKLNTIQIYHQKVILEDISKKLNLVIE